VLILLPPVCLEFPVRHQHECSGSSHVSTLEQHQPAHRFISSVTLCMHSFSTVAVKRIPNPFRTQLNLLSILLLSIGCNLSRPIWAPPDPTSYAHQARLTCSTDNARSWWFFSHLRGHASIAECDRSASSETSYRSRAPRSKPRVSRARVLPSYVSPFSFFRPRSSGSQRD